MSTVNKVGTLSNMYTVININVLLTLSIICLYLWYSLSMLHEYTHYYVVPTVYTTGLLPITYPIQ